MLGAIPIPDNKEATKNFFNKISEVIKHNNSITIYPEAHIWPYYTKIRPFKSVGFRYPVKLNSPVFCITNTYKRSKRDKVQIITYIDGPFFTNKELNLKDRQEGLRNQVYNTMVERSKNSNIEYIKYLKEK